MIFASPFIAFRLFFALTTVSRIILDVRKPPQGKVDPSAPYVAFTRATDLNSVGLLFPVTLRNLNMKRDPDVIALIACLDRLADDTLAAFRANPGTFTMCSASLQLESDEDDDVAPARISKNKGTGFRRGTGEHRGNSGPSSSAVVHLIPNKDNNCFFNSALALVVSAFDGQPFPEIQTPAAHAFFTAAGILQDAMLTNAPLPPHVLVRSI